MVKLCSTGTLLTSLVDQLPIPGVAQELELQLAQAKVEKLEKDTARRNVGSAPCALPLWSQQNFFFFFFRGCRWSWKYETGNLMWIDWHVNVLQGLDTRWWWLKVVRWCSRTRKHSRNPCPACLRSSSLSVIIILGITSIIILTVVRSQHQFHQLLPWTLLTEVG